ncbi:MAG TPA: tetratricopeptide repeat protein [Solirubrobacterales bacterium]|nr:tetratricopeptide repeat protein [Solirubrobacterales bacterium]
MSRSPSTTTLKILFAQSHNRCAAPGCGNEIVARGTPVDTPAVVGHVAHIVARSAEGPRGDPAFPKARLHEEANLLLLCGHHHSLVDAQDSTFTVEELRRWKESHVAGDGELPRAPVPDQVPPPPRGFVNRVDDLEELDRLGRVADVGGGPAVVVVSGTHGIGKSAIARHWARRAKARFVDGCLYTDFGELRHRGGVMVEDVLGGFLGDLGVPVEAIPGGFAARVALFRTHTARKRLLIVLDDVERAAEVYPLLPNAEGSMVLVAGRTPLPELVAEVASPLPLARLSRQNGEEILEAMIGARRARSEPEEVAELLRICDGLPVAMRVCGARLEIERDRPVSWLVGLLADEERRLEELGGPRGTLDAVFNDALTALGEDERRLYRRLGSHPGVSFTAAASAAAAEEPIVKAAALLERLAAAQLLEVDGARYRFHDLLRIHARKTARRAEPEHVREAVEWRVVRHYERSAWRADTAISPERLRIGGRPEDLWDGEPAFGSAESALAWFESERFNLIEAIRAAARRGWDREVARICEFLWPCYSNRKPFLEWIEAYRLGADAAGRRGDAATEARLRAGLAKALIEIDDLPGAAQELDAAERLAESSGHRHLSASVLEFRGHLELAQEDFAAARDAYQGSRDLHAEADVPRGVTLQDYHLGRALAGLGEDEAAVDSYDRALGGVDPETDELLMGRTLIHLAESRLRLDDPEAAASSALRALEIMRRHRLPYYEARCLEVLGAIDAETGRPDEAARRLRDAHAIYVSISSPRADLELFLPAHPG